jgi:hypothetical protein
VRAFNSGSCKGLVGRLDVVNQNCTVAGDPSFQLRLPVRLLFDDAPIPPALVGVENVLLDLFAWKQESGLKRCTTVLA